MFTIEVNDQPGQSCSWDSSNTGPHERIFIEFTEDNDGGESNFVGKVRIDVDIIDPAQLEQLSAILGAVARYWRASDAYLLGNTDIRPSWHMLNNPNMYDVQGNLRPIAANGS